MCALTQSKIIEFENLNSYRTTTCSDTFLGCKTNILNVQQIHVKRYEDSLIPARRYMVIC